MLTSNAIPPGKWNTLLDLCITPQACPYGTEDKEQVGGVDCGFAAVAVGRGGEERSAEREVVEVMRRG